MKAKDFIAKFDNSQFPNEFGPWVSFDDHDPPFTLTELKRMDTMGVIELETVNRRYRLTMKATAIRESR